MSGAFAQVSFLDIARNPLLARAARAELNAGNPEAAAASASVAAGVPLPDAEVAPLSGCACLCIGVHVTDQEAKPVALHQQPARLSSR